MLPQPRFRPPTVGAHGRAPGAPWDISSRRYGAALTCMGVIKSRGSHLINAGGRTAVRPYGGRRRTVEPYDF